MIYNQDWLIWIGGMYGCQTTTSISEDTSSPRLKEPMISKLATRQRFILWCKEDVGILSGSAALNAFSNKSLNTSTSFRGIMSSISIWCWIASYYQPSFTSSSSSGCKGGRIYFLGLCDLSSILLFFRLEEILQSPSSILCSKCQFSRHREEHGERREHRNKVETEDAQS